MFRKVDADRLTGGYAPAPVRTLRKSHPSHHRSSSAEASVQLPRRLAAEILEANTVSLRQAPNRPLVDTETARGSAPGHTPNKALVGIAPEGQLIASILDGIEWSASRQPTLQLELWRRNTACGQQHRERRRFAVVAQDLPHKRDPVRAVRLTTSR